MNRKVMGIACWMLAAGCGDTGSSSSHAGAVTLGRSETGSVMAATFIASSGASAAAGCTESTVGACDVVVCQLGGDAGAAPTADAGPAPTPSNAGLITVSVDGASPPLSIAVAGSGGYEAVTSPTPLWPGGATLAVSAAGSPEIPAFTASVVAPEVVTITAPLPGIVPIDRAMPLTFSWTGGTSDADVRAEISAFSTTSFARASCDGAASAGSLTIGTDVLGLLPEATSASIVVRAQRVTTVRAGDYEVAVLASTGPTTGGSFGATVR